MVFDGLLWICWIAVDFIGFLLIVVDVSAKDDFCDFGGLLWMFVDFVGILSC